MIVTAYILGTLRLIVCTQVIVIRRNGLSCFNSVKALQYLPAQLFTNSKQKVFVEVTEVQPGVRKNAMRVFSLFERIYIGCVEALLE